MKPYKSVKQCSEAEYTVNRSRFIGRCFPVESEEAALCLLGDIRKKHWDATHNCFAYRIGENAAARFSDDGEPGGTAGKPIMDVLTGRGLTNVLCVVTRYFGGIKLGTGGLVRAYQGMVKLGLETLPTREHMIPARVEVVLDYPHITVFRRLLPDYRATVASENFGVDATYELLLPDQNIPALETALTELTDGAVLITRLDDGTMPPETP